MASGPHFRVLFKIQLQLVGTLELATQPAIVPAIASHLASHHRVFFDLTRALLNVAALPHGHKPAFRESATSRASRGVSNM